MGYFKSVSILYDPVTDLTADNRISFVGSSDNTAASQTLERYLNYRILASPAKTQNIKGNIEFTTTSSYYGMYITTGYENRNLFKGMEQFNLSFRGGYEFMRLAGRGTSYDIGITSSFTFPHFVFRFQIDRNRNIDNARTRLDVSFNNQSRPYYDRGLFSASWGYTWSIRQHAFALRPADVNIVDVRSVSSDFLESLNNEYLKHSYDPILAAGISGSYQYVNLRMAAPVTLRVNVETMGNMLYGLSSLFDERRTTDRSYHLFGIRYAQYLRAELSFVQNFPLGESSSIVYRLYAAHGWTYGNSKDLPLPFDRLFFAGGSNSMRGWPVRTLGPGSSARPKEPRYPSQLGSMRLEANLEGRFPIWGVIGGAIFMDAGNIWHTHVNELDPDQVFRLNSFYKQLGLNTGAGVRFNFSIAVLRLDWGIRLHDPNLPASERWVIKHPKFANTALSLGVNYPF